MKNRKTFSKKTFLHKNMARKTITLKTIVIASAAIILGSIQSAQAHTSFVITDSSNAFAGKSYFATLNLGHGCEDVLSGVKFDTEKLEVDIPAGVTSIRPMDSAWATATVVKDVDGNITQLVWTRTNAPLAEDSQLYRVSFTAKLPDAPMTTLAFPARQICHNTNAVEITTPWEGAEAPTLKLLPPRAPGWNKYTAQADIDDTTINAFFSDAYIVWSGSAAYSANPVTAGLITNTLTIIPAGADFWVKY